MGKQVNKKMIIICFAKKTFLVFFFKQGSKKENAVGAALWDRG
jgi:hypothetical protein